MKHPKRIALALTVAAVLSTFTMNAVAAESDSRPGEAGIDFVKGGTVIEPTPDPELPGIQNTNIYFGEQELNGSTMTYNSVTTHDDPELNYAGFAVGAGHDEGWSVTAEITGFQMDDVDTMTGFELKLTPGTVRTTAQNTSGEAPTAYTVKLSGVDKDTTGASDTIFEAESGEGFGKWGCNWEGDLTVPGGSVEEEGEAFATMLWTLIPGEVSVG